MEQMYQVALYFPGDDKHVLKFKCNNKEFLKEFGERLNELHIKYGGEITIEDTNIINNN